MSRGTGHTRQHQKHPTATDRYAPPQESQEKPTPPPLEPKGSKGRGDGLPARPWVRQAPRGSIPMHWRARGTAGRGHASNATGRRSLDGGAQTPSSSCQPRLWAGKNRRPAPSLLRNDIAGRPKRREVCNEGRLTKTAAETPKERWGAEEERKNEREVERGMRVRVHAPGGPEERRGVDERVCIDLCV